MTGLKGVGSLGDMGYMIFKAKPAKDCLVFTFGNNYHRYTYRKGVGIGLGSIRELCEKYQGRMQVEDVPDGDGGRFQLTVAMRIFA